jgi:RNA ligase (TIGR02306 family)
MPQTIAGVVGDDITVEAGVTKYEKPIPVSMGGEIAAAFPSFIPKTDELLFQRVPEMLAALTGQVYCVTLKADGTSCTAYKWQGRFGVCSRNWELKETTGNVYWRVANQYALPEKLPEGYAVQFEVVGPSIQGNPMGWGQPDMRLFNVYNIQEKRYLGAADASAFSHGLGLRLVDVVKQPTEVFSPDIDLRKLSEQKYENGKHAEGIVIRPLREQTVVVDGKAERLSFKVINLLYRESE